MFKLVAAKPDFVAMEKKLLDWWYKSGLVKKYLQKNAKSKKIFSFIDGPITANNPMGVHHAWGRTYKDLWQRYKNMQGFKQRFQNGFDCQGLWVEVEVEKDLGFNSKKDIEKFGLANFAKACRERVDKYSKIQTDQSIRLGQFMDWENSYYTFTDTNIEYIWYFLKKCFEKGWLYKGYRALPWCARCGTSLSQHELSDSYKEMTHKSVFLKFPIKNKKNEYFLVWTTTPWTLTANVALAVHPDLTYVKVKTESEVLVLAKDLLKVLNHRYQVVEKFKGVKLKGLKYEAPFAEFPAQKLAQRLVLLWKDVSSAEGTGIVHIAPGCGEEDFQLGKENKLAVIVPLDENGNYVNGFGELTGKFAQAVDNLVFESLKKKGLLYKIENYTHSYPICWRCKEPIVFRAEENWFIAADKVRPKMIREARKVVWHPEYVGKLMEDWLKNMGDWNISRKRYFGLPLPFYECSCGELTLVGSKKELKKLAVEPKKVDRLPELHRPWIDEIKIRCPKCGKPVSRIKEIGDCWLDAGIVPFSTLKYFEEKKYWRQWFPADWVSEMREQVRLWFYSMLFMAVTLENRTPYLEVLSYEKLYDEKGQPMHKSAGNAIWFDEAAEKMGADVMRWMYSCQKTDDNLFFGYQKADETRRRFHLLLWNVYKFFVTYANVDKFKIQNSKFKIQNILDKWIISRLNQLIKEVTYMLDNYDAYAATQETEKFVEDLSTWYVRRSRDRIGPTAKNNEDKRACYQTLWLILVTLSKLIAPFMPFLSEEMFKNLTGKKSVHLEDWPTASQVDRKLLAEMEQVRKVCELGHAARKEAGIKVRQPLSQFLISNFQFLIDKELIKLIKDELNVKQVVFKPGKGELKIKLDTKITPELKAEGEARDLVRQIQELRKKTGCQLEQKIVVYGPNLPENRRWRDYLKKETLATKLLSGKILKVEPV